MSGYPSVRPRTRSATRAAGTARRAGARLFDLVVLAVPIELVLQLTGAYRPVAVIGTRGEPGMVVELQPHAILTAVLLFAYFTYLEGSRGHTLGKHLLDLRVIGADGRPPGLRASAKRNAWILLGFLGVGGFAWTGAVAVILLSMLRNPDGRAIHDRFAGARVVR